MKECVRRSASTSLIGASVIASADLDLYISCGRHECGRLCCPLSYRAKTRKKRPNDGPDVIDEDGLHDLHECHLTCGKILGCGIHTCPKKDHKGACGRCLQASYDEVSRHPNDFPSQISSSSLLAHLPLWSYNRLPSRRLWYYNHMHLPVCSSGSLLRTPEDSTRLPRTGSLPSLSSSYDEGLRLWERPLGEICPLFPGSCVMRSSMWRTPRMRISPMREELSSTRGMRGLHSGLRQEQKDL